MTMKEGRFVIDSKAFKMVMKEERPITDCNIFQMVMKERKFELTLSIASDEVEMCYDDLKRVNLISPIGHIMSSNGLNNYLKIFKKCENNIRNI